MDKVTLKKCVEKLNEMRAQTAGSIDQANKALIDYEKAEDLDDIDKSNNLNDISRLKKLLNQHSMRLGQIQAAESRIKSNKFGICLICEEDIPKDRLLANPTAIRCLECQEDLEKEEKENKMRRVAPSEKEFSKDSSED